MKSDKQTILKRIQEIYQMICAGANNIDIIDYARLNWNISRARTFHLIKMVYERIEKNSNKEIESTRKEANIRFDKLYTKLFKEGRYGDAGKIQAMKNKINGLEVQKVEHSGDINIKIDIEE